MKLLRRMIRKLILEGPVKDSFDEAWHNSEEERSSFGGENGPGVGTHHKDNLKDLYLQDAHDDIDQFFKDKRDLKRMWNEYIKEHNLRSFWEGPAMQYYHSLSYYGSPSQSKQTLATNVDNDEEIKDLTSWGFFQLYAKDGNKDEMSTYGIYNGLHQIPDYQTKFGVIISGRVTLATMDDAFTESRSKATKSDTARHASSGLPKRITPTDYNVQTLLFEEEDIKEFGKIGECIVDNWGIDAIVCDPDLNEDLVAGAEELAELYDVPLYHPKDLGMEM